MIQKSCEEGISTVHMQGPARSLLSARWPLVRLPPDGLTALGALGTLERLDLSGEHFPTRRITQNQLQELRGESQLVELGLHGAYLPGGRFVDALAQLPRLREVGLAGLDLTDSEVGAIARSRPFLTALALGLLPPTSEGHRFTAGRLTAAVVRELSGLSALRRLGLRGLAIDDNALLLEATFFERLVELDLGETRVGDLAAAHLARCPLLTRLALDQTRVTDRGVAALANAPVLNALDISWTAAGPQGVQQVLAGRRLSRLALAGLPLGDQDLEPLAVQESLVDLDLADTRAGDLTVARLAALSSLERLILDRTPIGTAGVTSLIPSGVQELSLRRCRIDREALRALARMPGLARVSLSLGSEWDGLEGVPGRIDLDAEAPSARPPALPEGLRRLTLHSRMPQELLTQLAELPHLEHLALAAGADTLAPPIEGGFRSLQVLFAESAGLDDAALERIGRLPSLEALFISDNPVRRSVAALDAPFLHTLELRDAQAVDDASVPALARLPRLHCLDLPGTAVSASGIAELVASAANLQSLALDAAQLTAGSIAAMASALQLVELYLYGPAVSDTVVARLISWTSLRELNLFGTSITDAVTPILEALPGLRVARISGGLSAAAILALRAARPDLQIIGGPSLGFFRRTRQSPGPRQPIGSGVERPHRPLDCR